MTEPLRFSVVTEPAIADTAAVLFGRGEIIPERGLNRVWFCSRENAELFRSRVGGTVKVSAVLYGSP